MKKSRALRLLQTLYAAPKRTMTLFELEVSLRTDWSPRAVSEARKIEGVEITGHNPYTLVQWPGYMFKEHSWVLVDSIHEKKIAFMPTQTSFL